MLTTAAALIGIIYQVLRQPEISRDPTIDPSRPFAFPFIVENKSWLFEMRDTQFRCGVDVFKFAAGGGIQGISLLDSKRATISPSGGTGLFTCSINASIPPPTDAASAGWRIVDGHIFVSVNYSTLGLFSRKSPETEFTWFPDGSPPHWVKGALAK